MLKRCICPPNTLISINITSLYVALAETKPMCRHINSQRADALKRPSRQSAPIRCTVEELKPAISRWDASFLKQYTLMLFLSPFCNDSASWAPAMLLLHNPSLPCRRPSPIIQLSKPYTGRKKGGADIRLMLAIVANTYKRVALAADRV